MAKVVLFGTGDFSQLAYEYLTHDSPHEIVAFTVHGSHLTEPQLFGLPVVPFEEVVDRFPPDSFQMYVAVGYRKVNSIRARIYEEAKSKGYSLVTYISSKCTLTGSPQIGDNCFVFEGNNIQPYAKIGNDCVLWSGNHIGHHSTIGDHCFLASHVVVSGHVRIGPYCFLGVNATLRDNITIGERCVVGAGALILKSTGEGEVFVAERTKAHRLSSDKIGM